MDGYYGRAGRYLTEYVGMQRQRLNQWPYGMVDYAFVQKMQQLFDRAEAAVKDDPELLARVQDARISADITTIFFKSKLTGEFVRQGNRSDDYPYKAAVLKERILSRLKRTTNPLWVRSDYPEPYPNGPWLTPAQFAERYVNKISLGNDYAPLPKEFQNVPAERLRDIPGYQFNCVDTARIVAGPGFRIRSGGCPADG